MFSTHIQCLRQLVLKDSWGTYVPSAFCLEVYVPGRLNHCVSAKNLQRLMNKMGELPEGTKENREYFN